MYSHYLWATGRGKYVKNPHKHAPGVECIFCAVAKNDPKVLKRVLHKDKDIMVIMNVFPYNVGHLQVVPVRHVIWPYELTNNEYEKFFNQIRKSIALLTKVLQPKGFNVGMNIGGDVAGGSIMHLHAQIVPRYTRDLGFMEVTADTKVMPVALDDTYKQLMKEAKMLR